MLLNLFNNPGCSELIWNYLKKFLYILFFKKYVIISLTPSDPHTLLLPLTLSHSDAARQIVREVTEHPDTAPQMARMLVERIKALNVDPKKARVYVTTLISEQNAVYMVRTVLTDY